MTTPQKKHLQQRLDGATAILRDRLNIRSRYDYRLPPEVRKLERAYTKAREAFQRERSRQNAKSERRVTRLLQPAREALLFGDARKALAAIKALERAVKRVKL